MSRRPLLWPLACGRPGARADPMHERAAASYRSVEPLNELATPPAPPLGRWCPRRLAGTARRSAVTSTALVTSRLITFARSPILHRDGLETNRAVCHAAVHRLHTTHDRGRQAGRARARADQGGQVPPPGPYAPGFDALHYALDLSVAPESKIITGVARIDLR